jgi:serine/threonine-protein kinase
LLADRYDLQERIAIGGMGVVWRARDERLGRDVAIKLIRPEYADDPIFRQRLRTEARATAAIRNPHVVRLHDVYEERDPAGGHQAFIVMELVDGQPLSAALHGGPLTGSLTTGIVTQAAAALAAAHDRQIIHRDIKPGNLMLDADGRVTVLDFGIARAADTVALTATDLILGTARYISPEQADGRGATTASDVYALGVVAYECLAGRVPFDAASDVAVALAHLRDPVPALPSDVPPPLAGLVERMLAKNPADRPTAHQVVAALAAGAAATPPIDATRPLPVPRPGIDLRDSRSAAARPVVLLSLAAVAAVALLITAAIAGGPAGAPHSAAAGRSTNTVADRDRSATGKVSIDPTDYLGDQWPGVRSRLRGLGLHPVAMFTGDGPPDTVVGLAPTGLVRRGRTITVVVSRLGPAIHPPAPKPQHGAPAGGGPGQGPPGQLKKHDD